MNSGYRIIPALQMEIPMLYIQGDSRLIIKFEMKEIAFVFC